MAKLHARTKRFIVIALACYDSPTQVANSVKDEFGLDVQRQSVNRYNPETVQGNELSKPLRELFYATREKFLAEVDKIPIANQAFRLRALNHLYTKAEKTSNSALAAQLLEQGAKEVGGAYTNMRRLSGGGPGTFPIETVPAGLDHFYGRPAPDTTK